MQAATRGGSCSQLRSRNFLAQSQCNSKRFTWGSQQMTGRPCRSTSLETPGIKTSVRNGAVSLPILPPLDGSYEASTAFSNFANWLIPGKVMLGRYPFVEPSRCFTREEGEKQLEVILDAGIDTFVCLQAELPPQGDMRIGGVNGFLPYKPTAELMMAARGGPPPMNIVEGLRNPQLDKYLPPRRRAAKDGAVGWGHKELGFLHFPIEDLSIPNADKLTGLLEELELRILAGDTLYVHCWGGRGRAGSVGALLLASMYNLSSEEALQRVQRAFDTRQDENRRSPETPEQFQFIRDFIAARPGSAL